MKICYYHNTDLDGISSAAIVKHRFPDVSLHGVNYNDKVKVPDNTTLIIIVDFSFPMHIMEEMQNICPVIWIDHHHSAIEEFNQYHKLKNITAVHLIGRAACELTWRHFFPEQALPTAIHLLGIYDTWRINEKPSHFDLVQSPWENITLPFQYAVRSHCIEPATFPVELFSQDITVALRYINDGKAILRYTHLQNRILASNAFERKILS
jgi:oligoribonuclease NrnB/cAMP/cGMP phosphodiesterase (DHH superfamily)